MSGSEVGVIEWFEYLGSALQKRGGASKNIWNTELSVDEEDVLQNTGWL